MSKILKVFLIILLLFLMNNCSEDNPIEPEKKYSGITRTSSASPDPIGEIDPDDWYYEPDTSSSGTSIPMKLSVFPAYPNPTTRYTTIRIATPQQDSIKIWIDDPMSSKQTIIVNKVLYAGVYEFQVDLNYGDDNFDRKTGIVRAFVDFTNVKDLPVIHGDIQIIE